MFGEQETFKIRRLQVTVYEIKTLTKSLAKLGSFVQVSLNDVDGIVQDTKNTMVVADDISPLWVETFELEIPPKGEHTLIVEYKTLSMDMQTKFVGGISLDINHFYSYQKTEEWYTLYKKKSSTTRKSKKLSIRLGVTYMEDIVLPSPKYNMLQDTMLEDLDTLLYLSSCLNSEYQMNFAKLFNTIFTTLDSAFQISFIEKLIVEEINQTDDETVLFRSPSLGCKTFEIFLNMYGAEWRNTIVRQFLKKMMNGEKFFYESDDHLASIETHLTNCLNILYESVESVPVEIKRMLNIISEATQEKFHDEDTTHISVSSFIVLRLLTPAILNPKLFDIINYFPTHYQIEDFKILASFMQKLGNLSTYIQADKPLESLLNKILVDQQENMTNFIKVLSEPVSIEKYYQASSNFIELITTEFSMLTRMLIRIRITIDEPNESLKKFITHLDDILYLIHTEQPHYWENQLDFDDSGLERLQDILREKDPSITLERSQVILDFDTVIDEGYSNKEHPYHRFSKSESKVTSPTSDKKKKVKRSLSSSINGKLISPSAKKRALESFNEEPRPEEESCSTSTTKGGKKKPKKRNREDSKSFGINKY
eukprot:TRINITY_DN3484_c0_g1_i1.p1 TRINITY_DN3484_c0_g1~~TRINITY_DN3484_c0_g1_i1.p1  ORF type:complete len:606 (-),score=123.13 TRINITY_DN3484_c0_g1_i1:195-1982(-)